MKIFKRLVLKMNERKALDDYMRIEYKNEYKRCKTTGICDQGYIRDSYYNRKF